MPNGKPAGVPCIQLDEWMGCRLFGQPERPAVCHAFKPDPEHCGGSRAEALVILTRWETETAAD